MRRVLVSLLLACTLAFSGAFHASAQQAQVTNEQKAAEFSELLERWRQVQDFEQKITLGEQLLAAEAKLASWPEESPRAAVKADISFELGSAYLARAKGEHADNLERAITLFEAALTGWTARVGARRLGARPQ